MAARTVMTRQTDTADEMEALFEIDGMTVVVACWMAGTELVVEIRDPRIRAVVLYNGYPCYPLFGREMWKPERP